jgi:hypothetical protein
MKTNALKNTTCCIIGCSEPAVEFAAPNVPYCHRHVASNNQATKQYMQRHAGIEQSIKADQARSRKATAVVLGHGRVAIDGVGEYDCVIGTQYDRDIIALRSPEYRETTYGDVLFVRPGDVRYDEFRAVAIQA